MKQFILAVVVLMFAAPAFGAESWAATGTKVIQSKAITSTIYLDFNLNGFESLDACNDSITAAQAQTMSKSETLTIYATCVNVRTTDAPE